MTFFKDGSKWTEETKLLKCNTLKTKIRIRSYKRKPITNHYPTLYFFFFPLSLDLLCMQHQTHVCVTYKKGPGGICHSCDRRWKEGSIMIDCQWAWNSFLWLLSHLVIFFLLVTTFLGTKKNLQPVFWGIDLYRGWPNKLRHPVYMCTDVVHSLALGKYWTFCEVYVCIYFYPFALALNKTTDIGFLRWDYLF